MRASGHPDKFHCLLRRDRERQRFRISEADVFARENDDAPRDETKIFAGMQHFREPVDRAFFIRSAHAFDERTDRVVVRVADAIVDDGLLLDAFLRDRELEMNNAVAGLSQRRCCSSAVGPPEVRGRTPISSAFSALRASPSLSFGEKSAARHRSI